MTAAEILWTPSPERIAASRMERFRRAAESVAGRPLPDYAALHAWSIEDLPAFWRMVLEDAGIVGDGLDAPVVDDERKLPGAKWFEGATLNFAENLLGAGGAGGDAIPRPDDADAILFRGEHMHRTRRVTWGELRREVGRVAAVLRDLGVAPGDRVAGFLPNLPETVIAMLAATSLGAIWSSCSPDFGVKGVLDRFTRIEPSVILYADGYVYAGRTHDSREKMRGILEGLAAAGTTPRVLVVPYVESEPDVSMLPGARRLPDAIAALGAAADAPLDFVRVPFAHPVYVMYSSGTTGLPKCIVQSAGGVLLNQLKEHRLHVDLHPGDVIFYFTTCGWMMWNWLVAGLGAGGTIALYDGSPFQPDANALMRYADAEGFAFFGAGAAYYAALEKAGAKPREQYDFAKLRSILSTGSPLADESFDYLYRDVKPDMQLASISGGTDLNGCFVGGTPLLPVRRGEIQAPCLGMAVEAWDEDGRRVVGERGELVCTKAFPSMPVFFWGDEDGSKYRAAYFERFPGVWHHGDYVEIAEHLGVRIHGRSDATLNPGGVRIGTAEIYRVVEQVPWVADSLVIGQQVGDDERVVLFVRLREGEGLDAARIKELRTAIREGCSPRHVPAKVVAVADIPYTISMKKVELAVRDVVHGREVRNRDALRNPEALELYRDLAELRD